jgi:polyhydroxybutyrate depolymerase
MPERRSGARSGRGLAVVLLAVAVAAPSCSSATSRSSPTTAGSRSSTTVGSTASPSTATCTPRPHAAGQFAQTFSYLGVTRTYQLYVPSAYRGTSAVPLVFDFHGYGSSAVGQMAYGNFKPLADRDDFVIVAPDGQGTRRHFNFGREPGLQNDVAMVLALLDHIEAAFCIDPARVFSTGMSNGGAMTSVLACVAPNRFAAFGPVAVEISPPRCGAHPVAIVAFHGTDDPVVPYGGGEVRCCSHGTVEAAPTAMAGWAAHDHCDARFTDTSLGTEVRRREWAGCDGTSTVVLYSIEGGGHTWPGGLPIARLGMTTRQIDASATIWAFFTAHPLHD